MRRAAVLLALLPLAACVGNGPQDNGPMRSDTHQQPSVLTPGITLSGYANIGVIKQF